MNGFAEAVGVSRGPRAAAEVDVAQASSAAPTTLDLIGTPATAPGLISFGATDAGVCVDGVCAVPSSSAVVVSPS